MTFDLPATPVDMTGPWQAVAVDPAGYVLDPHDDDMTDCDGVTVVRRTAVPGADGAPERLPAYYHPNDILYRRQDLMDNPEWVMTALAQAVAVAEAMNGRYPVDSGTAPQPSGGEG